MAAAAVNAAFPVAVAIGIGIPLWPVLFVWTLIEVIVVVRDARGDKLSKQTGAAPLDVAEALPALRCDLFRAPGQVGDQLRLF